MNPSFRTIAIVLLVFVFTSCYKRKTEIDGIYVGEERYVKLSHSNSNDTICDVSSNMIVDVDLTELYEFRIWKPDDEDSYEIEVNANKLVRKDTVKGSRWLLPSQEWEVAVNDEGLYLHLHETNSWSGSNEHFYFKGIKDN